MDTTRCRKGNNRQQIQVEFTHKGFVMGKLFDFLSMTNKSWAKNRQNFPMSGDSYIEDRKKLYITNSICIENRTFLYMKPVRIHHS